MKRTLKKNLLSQKPIVTYSLAKNKLKFVYFLIFFISLRLGIFKILINNYCLFKLNLNSLRIFIYNVYFFLVKFEMFWILKQITNWFEDVLIVSDFLIFYFLEYYSLTLIKVRNFKSKFFSKIFLPTIIPYSKFFLRIPIFSFFSLGLYMEHLRAFYYALYINTLKLSSSLSYLIKQQLNVYTFRYKHLTKNTRCMFKYKRYFFFSMRKIKKKHLFKRLYAYNRKKMFFVFKFLRILDYFFNFNKKFWKILYLCFFLSQVRIYIYLLSYYHYSVIFFSDYLSPRYKKFIDYICLLKIFHFE